MQVLDRALSLWHRLNALCQNNGSAAVYWTPTAMAPVLASPARAAPLLAGRVLPPMSSMPTAAVAVPLPMPDGVPALPLPDSPPEGPSGIAERRIWSAEEDVQIAALVAEHGTRSWSIIAAKLPTRTGKQCRERWHNRTPLHARDLRPKPKRPARFALHHPTLTLFLSRLCRAQTSTRSSTRASGRSTRTRSF